MTILTTEQQLELKNQAYNNLLNSYKELQLRVERQQGSQSEDAEHVRMTLSERKKLKETNQRLKEKAQSLEQQVDSHLQALQTSQEWHERQKGEIIAEWKGKLTSFINSRKTTIQQEITLIKEILSHE